MDHVTSALRHKHYCAIYRTKLHIFSECMEIFRDRTELFCKKKKKNYLIYFSTSTKSMQKKNSLSTIFSFPMTINLQLYHFYSRPVIYFDV